MYYELSYTIQCYNDNITAFDSDNIIIHFDTLDRRVSGIPRVLRRYNDTDTGAQFQ